MNTELRTGQIPGNLSAPITLGSAKRVESELKTRSKATRARKKSTTTKKGAAKRRTIVKMGSSGKGASSRKKLTLAKETAVEQLPAEMATHPSLHLPVEGNPPVSCESLPQQSEPFAADDVIEPAVFTANNIDFEAVKTAEATTLEPLLDEFDVVPTDLASESIVLCEDNAPTPTEAASAQASNASSARFAVGWKSLASFLTAKWNWALEKFKSHQVRKRLRVCETVSLGEKRFVAVIQVDGEQFLVGGSSSSVSTLAHLERSRDFSDVFQRQCGQDLSRA